MGKRGLQKLQHREPWDKYDWRSEKKKAKYEECNPEIVQHGQWQFLCKVEDGDGSSVCLDDIYIRFLFFWWVMGSRYVERYTATFVMLRVLSGSPLQL